MKKLLPILLCYILMTSQVFAISGGPVFGGGGTDPQGTYSGIITVNTKLDFDNPVFDPVTNTFVPAVVATNAIGLFSLTVPATNLATGTNIIFVDGAVYRGTINASVDPDSGRLSGLISASFNYTLVTTNPVSGEQQTASLTAQANGKLDAQITGARQAARASARLLGSSTISVANGGVSGFTFDVDSVLQCTVTGFRQATQ